MTVPMAVLVVPSSRITVRLILWKRIMAESLELRTRGGPSIQVNNSEVPGFDSRKVVTRLAC